MALTADRKVEMQVGIERSFPVAASTKIYSGGYVCLNAAGYAVPAADTAGLKFQGVAMEQVDNSSGANGDKNITVRRKGVFRTAGSSLAQAQVGDTMYIVDDETVAAASVTTNDIPAGTLVGVESATDGWLSIG